MHKDIANKACLWTAVLLLLLAVSNNSFAQIVSLPGGSCGGSTTFSTSSFSSDSNTPCAPTSPPVTSQNSYPVNTLFTISMPQFMLHDVNNPTFYDVVESRNNSSYSSIAYINAYETYTVNRQLSAAGAAYYKYRVCNSSGCSGYSPVKTLSITSSGSSGDDWLAGGGAVNDQVFSAPTITPTNFYGQTSGSPSVSGGAGSYNIPIDVVPGRAGMAPSVSLNYSSRAGVGIAGVGWSLNASGSISRCEATLAQDGFMGAVKFNYSNDKLCLSGKRLIAFSGAYGAANTEYRFEIDDFTRVYQRVGNTDYSSTYYEVIRPDGSKSYYGNTSDSRVSPSGTSKNMSWLLSSTYDVSGKNHISYKYTSFGAGEKLLSSILYTGNGSTDGNRKVVFTYENKNKPRRSYKWGTYSESTKRLNYIDTFYGSTRVKRYDLSYVSSRTSGRSLLSTVQECGYTNGTRCKEKTTFNWSDDTPSISFERFSINNSTMYAGEKKIENIVPRGDINGDGVRDWKGYFVNAEGELTGTTSKTVDPCHMNIYKRVVVCAEGDFNKDGLTDDWRNYNGTLQLKYSSINGSNPWFSTGIRLNKKGTYYTNFQDDHIMHVGDYNGDSWPDLMVYRFENYDNPKLWLYRHTGNVSSPYSTSPQLVYTFQSVGSVRVSLPSEIRPLTSVQFMGDIDGDNTLDLLVSEFGSDGKYSINYPQPKPKTFLFNSGSGVSYTQLPFSYIGSGSTWASSTFFTFFTDINGDGLTDWIGWRENPNSNTSGILVAKINKGNRVFGAEQIVSGDNFRTKYSFIRFASGGDAEYTSAMYGNALKIADIDSDGISEILEPGQRLVESCTQVTDHNAGVRTVCGDDIYGAYRTSSDTVAQIDASERDDSIYKWNAFHFSQDTSGNISLTKKETNYVGHAYQSAFIDSHGKGLLDLVSLHTNSFSSNTFRTNGSGTAMQPYFGKYGAYFSRNKGAARGSEKYLPHDLIESVVAPKGISASWIYRPLTTGEYSASQSEPYYSTDFDYTEQLQGGEGEYLHFASSMYAVAEFKIDNGVGGQNKHLYRYNGAVFNTKGRGFMGFREITLEDTTAAILAETTFEQMFPMVGLISTTSKTQVGKSKPFSITTNEWVETAAYNGVNTYKLHKAKQETKTYDINSLYSELSSTVTEVEQSGVDRWGNILTSTTRKLDYFSEVISTKTAIYDATIDWPHRLKSSTTVKGLNARNTSVLRYRTNTFTRSSTTNIEQWDEIHRKPKKLIVSGGTSPLTESQCLSLSQTKPCNVTINSFNLYGLPTQELKKGVVKTGGSGSKRVETRKVSTTYSDNGSAASAAGYFPFSVILENGNYDHRSYMYTSPYFGGVTKAVDANGVTTSTKYDSFFRPIEITSQGVAKQTLTYATPDSTKGSNNVLFMVSTAQAGAPRSKQYFDENGNALRTAIEGFTNGQWIYTDKRFNALGQLTHESVPHYGTPVYTNYTGYDVLGRLTGKTVPAVDSLEDYSTTYTYSGLNTEIETSASDGPNLFMSRKYDSSGLLMETIDANSGRTRYGYDAMGNPVVIEDAANNKIVAHYDDLGRKLWVSDPNQGTTTFSYNAFGELAHETDANGGYQRFDYDLLGRVKSRYSTNGTATFTWDTRKRGKLSKSSVLGAAKEYYYDSFARNIEVKTTIDGTAYSTKTAYNGTHGFVKAIAYPNNLQVALSYNSRGYLTTEKNASSGYVYRTVTERDSFGNIKKAQIADNKQQGEYLYSGRTGQMLMSLVKAAGNTVHYLDYDNYDSYGNLRSQANRAMSTPQRDTYYYDNLQRLTRSSISVGTATTHIDYGYDAVGNLKKKTDYSTNNNNAYSYFANSNKVSSIALKGGGSVSFGYDNKGNLTKRNNITELAYNVLNKPTSINRLGSEVTLFYDADWSRYKQIRVVEGKTIITHYVDGVFEVEKEGSKTKETSYISDVAIVIEETGRKRVRFTHRDRLGSATTFTDDNNNVTAYRFFDPFGKPRMGDGSLMQSFGMSARLGNSLLDVDMATRRGFTDHEHLDEVELIHMNGRVYDYNLGRFLSVDPLIHMEGGSQGINPYSYIMNNPMAGLDPSGYDPELETVEVSADAQVYTDSDGNNYVDAGDGSGDVIKIDSISVSKSNGSTTNYSFSSGGSLASMSTTEIGSPGNVAQSGGSGNQNGRVERQTDGSVLTPDKDQGITGVDDDGVPSFDETHEDFHHYYLDNSCAKATSGCTIENVRNGLQRYPAPGANGEPVSDEQIGFALPVGYVRHEVSADGGTVINVTLPPSEGGLPRHLLNPGIVRRWVTQDKNRVYIHTYGEGTGPLGRPNEVFKHQVWDRVDAQAFEWATGGNR
ncbi:SpvB/TcaC N-terminal domain-containing protein [Alteromonas sp. A079]|uniref:SpvB/TcaC N-terminal domain-containing protein n=1 Tax=Alteromonas sp. A079 TaxID=3410268 RepID=UPI003BA1B6D1